MAGVVEKIVAEVKRHYAETKTPYYLAKLGTWLRHEGVIRPANTSLKDFVASLVGDQLTFPQHPRVLARIAVALPENRDTVLQQITEEQLDPERLPLALIAAFCKTLDGDKRLFFRVTPPFRYYATVEKPDEAAIEIAPQFLIKNLQGKNVHDLTPSERGQIFEQAQAWAQASGVSLERLSSARAEARTRPSLSMRAAGQSALERLIEAQDEDIRHRVKIPADIIALLMRSR